MEKNHTFILPFLNEAYPDRQIANVGKLAFLEISQLMIKWMFATDDHFSTPI